MVRERGEQDLLVTADTVVIIVQLTRATVADDVVAGIARGGPLGEVGRVQRALPAECREHGIVEPDYVVVARRVAEVLDGVLFPRTQCGAEVEAVVAVAAGQRVKAGAAFETVVAA